MTTRRQFLAFASAIFAAVPAWAAQRKQLPIGHVHPGQRTALQPTASRGGRLLEESIAALVVRHSTGQNPISDYEVKIRTASRTGSMRPAYGDDDIILVERAPYEELRLGDIVEGANNTAQLMAEMGQAWTAGHRIVGGRPGAWVTRGDNNQQRDNFLLTPETYTGWRVIAAFYTRKPETP